MRENYKCDPNGCYRCLISSLTKLLWFGAIVSVVLAWVSGAYGLVLGQSVEFWYINALVLGVLSIGGGRSRCGVYDCGTASAVCPGKKVCCDKGRCEVCPACK